MEELLPSILFALLAIQVYLISVIHRNNAVLDLFETDHLTSMKVLYEQIIAIQNLNKELLAKRKSLIQSAKELLEFYDKGILHLDFDASNTKLKSYTEKIETYNILFEENIKQIDDKWKEYCEHKKIVDWLISKKSNLFIFFGLYNKLNLQINYFTLPDLTIRKPKK